MGENEKNKTFVISADTILMLIVGIVVVMFLSAAKFSDTMNTILQNQTALEERLKRVEDGDMQMDSLKQNLFDELVKYGG